MTALAPVAAREPAAAESPAPAPLADLVKRVDIPYEEFRLANGLTVLVHTDRKAPIVAVSVWYGVGSKHEPEGKTGYAHLFEHIMFNGTSHAPEDYFSYTKAIGATDLNGTTWLDRTNYFQTVPKNALEAALFLESDRMGYLLGGVDQAKLDNQIGVVQNEKRQNDNQPYGLVDYKQTELLFPADHPYGHTTIGSMADLQRATLADMRDWFTGHYGPNNAIIALAGDIDAAEARPLMEKWFGAIPAGPEIPKLATPLPPTRAAQAVLKDRVPVTRLYRNWTVPGLNDADSTALGVGAAVLGGLASSRLDKTLVRGEKLAVSASANIQPFVLASTFEVRVDVAPGQDADAVAKRLDAIMADFIATGPTDDEVRRVATSVAAARIDGLDQSGGFGGKATTLAEGKLYSNDPAHYKKELAELAAMTPAKVKAAMARWVGKPGVAIRVVPGERDPYEEPQADKAGAKAKPGETAAPAVKPKGGPDRSAMPKPAGVPDLDYPAVETAMLSSGVKVHVARRADLPVVRLALSFDAGYASDPAEALGTTSLMTRMLKEGTATRSAIEILESEERLGASIGAGSSLDRTTVSLRAVKPNLAPSLDLLADVVRNPSFDAKELERVRVQQLTRIDAEMAAPQSLALRTLPPLLFGKGHPYAAPLTGSGEKEVVAKLTGAELAAHKRQWLRPERMEIFVVGDTSAAEIVPLLDARFGNWPTTREALRQKAFPEPKPAAPGRITLVDRPDSPQSLILAGQVLDAKGTDDLFDLTAANEVIGGDFLSRINMDLRETKGWSYGAFSLLFRPQERVPYILLAPVQADQTGPAVQAILTQMTDFVGAKGVTEAERERTVTGNILTLAGDFETSGAVLAQMQADALYGRPFDYPETLAARYRNLSGAAMDKAARAAFDPRALSWVVIGDASKIEAQLRATGLPVDVRRTPSPTAGTTPAPKGE